MCLNISFAKIYKEIQVKGVNFGIIMVYFSNSQCKKK